MAALVGGSRRPEREGASELCARACSPDPPRGRALVLNKELSLIPLLSFPPPFPPIHLPSSASPAFCWTPQGVVGDDDDDDDDDDEARRARRSSRFSESTSGAVPPPPIPPSPMVPSCLQAPPSRAPAPAAADVPVAGRRRSRRERPAGEKP